MAVSVGGASGSGRRKSLDAEINLVSFIDLLSMCICFLLMTAVWLQVGSLQVKQSHGTEGTAMTASTHEIELTVSSAQSLQWVLKKGGRPVQKQKLDATSGSELALKLQQSLASVVASPNLKGAPISAAMISSSPTVSYGDLIQVMDALRKNQVVNLGVVPASRDAALSGISGGKR